MSHFKIITKKNHKIKFLKFKKKLNYDLQFDCFAIQINCANFLKLRKIVQLKSSKLRISFKSYKVDSNGADVALGICVVLKLNKNCQ